MIRCRTQRPFTLPCPSLAVRAALGVLTAGLSLAPLVVVAVDKTTYHYDHRRSGWNDREAALAPSVVRTPAFGQLWQTERLDSLGDREPRLFATPLYVDRVKITTGEYAGREFSVIYASTDVGYVYAINAHDAPGVPAGTFLWRRRVTEDPTPLGNLSTPVIDLSTRRLYLTTRDGKRPQRVHALDLGSGEDQAGWPLNIDPHAVNRPGVNRNGTTQFPAEPSLIQRGALNLSPDASRLYIAFGNDAHSGWILGVDTRVPRIATAFSSTARTEETQGGMWSSGGPSIDSDGHVHIATGASVHVMTRKLGLAGVFAQSPGNWGQSVIRLRDDQDAGFSLVGTYTPFNYEKAQAHDIDLGSSGTIVVDLDPSETQTPRLLVLGGTKQGNVYLLNRDRMPGSLERRPPPTDDPETDGSLLAPQLQPHLGKRGPLHLFGPYSDIYGMNDQARSRSTPAYFRSATTGKHYVFVSGSAKTGERLQQSVPPGLARVEIVTEPGQPAYLRLDQLENIHVFHNPGSPVVTSHDGRGAVVWVLDANARRTAPMQGPAAPRPVLYAFDALTFELLWKSAPGELGTSGKYNEPTVVRGLVVAGTDRLQVFGLRSPARLASPIAPVFTGEAKRIEVAAPAVAPAVLLAGKEIYQQRCHACHGAALPGVPPEASLAALERSRIVDALETGVMKPQAFGLEKKDIHALAAYVNSLSSPPAEPRVR